MTIQKNVSNNWKLYRSIFVKNDSEYFITIDPGLRKGGGTGIAIFNEEKLISTRFFNSNLSNYIRRMNDICRSIRIFSDKIRSQVSKGRSIPMVFIERPIFEDSARGAVAASTDSLFKLMCLYGRIYEIFDCRDFYVNPISITHWKGQLSKTMTKNRIRRIFIEYKYNQKLLKTLSEDEIDAIGMGLYLLGVFY